MKMIRMLLVLGMCGAAGCEHLPLIIDVGTGSFVRPEVTFRKLDSVDVSFERTTFHFLFDVRNPNRSGIFLAGYDAAFAVEGHTFLNSKSTDEISMPGLSSQTVAIPVTVVFDELRHTLKKAVEQDEIGYTLNGGLRFRGAVVDSLRIPVVVQGRFPVPRPPGISVKHLKIKRASVTKGVVMNLGLELENPNGFELSMNDLGFAFSVGGTRVAQVRLEPQKLRKKSRTSVTMPLEVSSLGVVKTLIEVLSEKQVSYALDGSVGVGLWEFKPWIHRFSYEGTVETSRER